MDRHRLRQYLEYFQDLGIRELYRPAAAAPAPKAAVVEAPGAGEASRNLKPGSADAPPPLEPLTESLFESFSDLAPPGDSLEIIRADIGDCQRCRLHEGRNSIVFGTGSEQAKIVFVGEGPGADEDAQGIPFVGRAGQLLTQMIESTAKKEGIPLLRKDVYICNAVKCRPPENRTPLPDELETCGQFLFRQVLAIRPKAICLLGATAVKALLGRREGVTRLRGNWFRWRDIPVMVTYHPSFLLRPYNQNAKREAWEDLKKLFHYVYD